MKFPCTLKNTLLIIRDRFGLSFASKGLGYLAALLLPLSLLARTNYLAIKLLVTYNFSACRHYLAENRLSFPSAPCWVRHSYLSKRAKIDPLYLWVIRKQSRSHHFHYMPQHPILVVSIGIQLRASVTVDTAIRID